MLAHQHHAVLPQLPPYPIHTHLCLKGLYPLCCLLHVAARQAEVPGGLR